MPRRRNFRNASGRGFTLIEVVVALSIMALALVTLLGVVQAGLRATFQRRSMETAQMLVNRVVAEVDALYAKPLDNETKRGDFGNEFPEYSWEYTLKVNENLENMKSMVPEIPITIFAIEAKVIWVEDGEEREYSVRTVKGWVEAAKQ